MTECDQIKAIINSQNHIALPKTTRVPESLDKVSIEPIGLDRNKNRIWALDSQYSSFSSVGTDANPKKEGRGTHIGRVTRVITDKVDSGRLYKSANPFKRPYVPSPSPTQVRLMTGQHVGSDL